MRRDIRVDKYIERKELEKRDGGDLVIDIKGEIDVFLTPLR